MKNSKKGISLIVLVITIIVIIILAAAVILTLNNNNPIKEANDARYSSDVANMQAVLTNTVAKIMASNQSTITIEETVFEDDALDTEIPYALDYPLAAKNQNGVIIFGKSATNPTTKTEGEGDAAVTIDVWYTGRELPDYNAGTEEWTVSEEGTLTLTVDVDGDNTATYPKTGVK